jgi:hypothetical protein
VLVTLNDGDYGCEASLSKLEIGSAYTIQVDQIDLRILDSLSSALDRVRSTLISCATR